VTFAWSATGLVVAVLLQKLLGLFGSPDIILPDPFLILLVYAALRGGETRGMLFGMASGWVQDVLFAGPIVGFSALAKLLVGFGVGVAGARFLVSGVLPRALVTCCAALLDILLHERLAAALGVEVRELPLQPLLLRAALSGLLAVPCFALLDRRVMSDPP